MDDTFEEGDESLRPGVHHVRLAKHRKKILGPLQRALGRGLQVTEPEIDVLPGPGPATGFRRQVARDRDDRSLPGVIQYILE